MLDLILKLFDLFNETASKMAAYLPQSGADVIRMFQSLTLIANNLNIWISNNIGANLQTALAPLGRLLILWLNFLLEAVKIIVGKL
ncbi:MAG: hypothetical protein HYY86_03875 [Candidatus Harrisonbacteria bacterium]|nr:hypothetical protein [Candidatus Harrisonbacteria bacterium]